jgi:hypothetical protein
MSRNKFTAQWQSLFNPKTGAFAVNIRDIDGDDSELRESLKEFGWVKEFPALADENGVVLVGHRRLKIAEEEKIEPVIKKLAIGNGDASDAERLKLAIVSNIGSKPMTPEDRKRIAEHLYGKREWTMARIAEALNVAQSTITEDLRDLSTTDKSKRSKTASNPKGSGRPKGSRSKKPDPATKEQPPPPAPQHTRVEPAKPDSNEPSSAISPPVGQTDLAESKRCTEPPIAPPASRANDTATTDTTKRTGLAAYRR